jgi:hypothetical protein
MNIKNFGAATLAAIACAAGAVITLGGCGSSPSELPDRRTARGAIRG